MNMGMEGLQSWQLGKSLGNIRCNNSWLFYFSFIPLFKKVLNLLTLWFTPEFSSNITLKVRPVYKVTPSHPPHRIFLSYYWGLFFFLHSTYHHLYIVYLHQVECKIYGSKDFLSFFPALGTLLGIKYKWLSMFSSMYPNHRLNLIWSLLGITTSIGLLLFTLCF